MTSPSLRAKANAGGSTAANVTCNVPAGVANNDILLFFLSKDAAGTVTWPSGWTVLVEGTGSSFYGGIGWRRASSEPANYTWTFASTWRDCVMLAYQGVVTGENPFDPDTPPAIVELASVTSIASNNDTTATVDTVAVVFANCMNINAWAAAPAGWTAQQAASANELHVMDQAFAAAQTITGPTTGTSTTSAGPMKAYIVALQSVAAGGATTAYKDATARIRAAARAFKDATVRIRAAVRAFRDATVRVGVRIQGYRDATARVRTAARVYRDATVRLVVQGIATGYRDASVRVRAAVRSFRDATVRVVVRIQGYRDSTVRIRTAAQGYRDATVRVRAGVLAFRDASVRIRAAATGFKDATLRLRVGITGVKDATVRVRTAAPAYRFATVRIVVAGVALVPRCPVTVRGRLFTLLAQRRAFALNVRNC